MKEWFCQTIRDNSLKAMEFTSLGSTLTDLIVSKMIVYYCCCFHHFDSSKHQHRAFFAVVV